jgi:uncharacterized membrane protein YeaQ/YmgE (transglycosylase-associated protein family)
MDIFNILIMVLIGAVAGSLAARIMKGDSFGLIVNAILGIAGAVVGGYIFDMLKINPGAGISHMIYDTFGVQLPAGLIGTIITATVGAIIIIWFFQLLKGKKRRR